uniref:Tripartite motif-containing protein 40-like n=1 Tax=Crassostrea virginica TaxID=6565 RepID=A0A8B8A9U0_CRAVI|nr:tripartite motif-containing protein 40-like [Crassostrea virginica]
MDPHYDAQDVARCDLCEIALVQSYCDFCHVNLCKPCIGEHISDDYSKHTIVPFQQRRSTLIYPKCEKHPSKPCEFQCKDCTIFLCSHCLASKQHKDHELLKLDEIFNEKKDHIQKDKEEIKKQLLPAYEDITSELENQIANIDVDYRKLTMEMSKHREELHREIDNEINQREKEIDENKAKHLSILKKHLEEIKQLQSLMQETLHDLNEIMDSNETTLIIHYSSKNQEFSKLTPKVIVSMPRFIPKPIEKEELCSLIGKLTPLSTTLEERVFTAKKPNTSVRDLLDEPEVLNTIKTGHERLCHVTCLNEEEIWTSGETADIKCFNSQGVLQKTIKTKSGKIPPDIALYSDGALLYSDGIRTVYKVKNDQIQETMRLQGWTPICVSPLLVISWLPCTVMIKLNLKSSVTQDLQ